MYLHPSPPHRGDVCTYTLALTIEETPPTMKSREPMMKLDEIQNAT